MIQVVPHVWVGDEKDEQAVGKSADWFVVSAAKEPWHRETVGYDGRALPKFHREYLFAEREHRLALNLVDVEDPRYISSIIMNTAAVVIHKKLAAGLEVLVHCNKGGSRGPGVALWYIRRFVHYTPDFEQAFADFLKLYPAAEAMKGGMKGFLHDHWEAGQ